MKNGCNTQRVARNRKMPPVKKSRAWFFTWDKPDIDFVEQLRSTFGDLEFVFQLECANSGLIHVQGVMRFKNPVSKWPNVNCHWERCRNWRSAIKYCSKVSTRIDGPWTNIKGLKWRDTVIDPMKGKTLYKWQAEIIDTIKDKPDDRKVYWYWDPEGNTGKSCLAKHIRMKYSCIVLNGTAKDCFCALKTRLEDNDIKIVIFDLSRSQKNYVSYQAIEQIKNGMFFSGKYESNDIIMNPPHLIVFANFEPDHEKLSLDRWKIKDLRDF